MSSRCLNEILIKIPTDFFYFIFAAYNLRFILRYLFGVLCRFQHCTGHITTGSWKGRRNQYIQLVKVLYYKLPTNGKQLPAFPLEAVPGTELRPQRWEARVLPLCHRFILPWVVCLHLYIKGLCVQNSTVLCYLQFYIRDSSIVQKTCPRSLHSVPIIEWRMMPIWRITKVTPH